MAILSRVRFEPQQRLDLEDVNALLSALRTDSKLYTKQVVSSSNLVFKGFTVSGIGLKSATVTMPNSTLIIPQNSFDFSWFTAAPAEANVVIPDSDLIDGSRNYVEIELLTQDNTPLTKAFWDPEANSGLGSEFNQTIDTITDLKVNFVTSISGFSGSADRLPLCIIDTDGSGNIKMILDRRILFGRLGTPTNPSAEFSWGSHVEPPYVATLTSVSGTFLANETITFSGGATATVTSGGTTNISFQLPSGVNFASGNTVTGSTSGATGTLNTVLEQFTGADKDLGDYKQNFDAIKTEIKRLKGTPFWHSIPENSLTGVSSVINSALVPLTHKAQFFWTGTNLKISDDNVSPSSADQIAKLRLLGKNQQLQLSRQDGTGGSAVIPIADGQVMFIKIPASGDRTYSGVGSGNTNYQVVSYTSFVISDENYWIAYRQGAMLALRDGGDLSAGEGESIGDTVPITLLDNIGLADEVTPANYTSNVRGTQNESIVSRESVLTDAVGDEQEDRSGYLRSADTVTWTGTQLDFTADIILEILNTKSGTSYVGTIVAPGPAAVNNGESYWVKINRSVSSENLTLHRTSVTPIPAQTQADKDVIVLWKRVDAGGSGYLHFPFTKQMMTPGQSSRLGQSGSGSGTVKATFYDPVSTTLPTGVSVTIDGVIGSNGDTVLFSNLISGNNEIYTLSGVGTSIAWTPVRAFSGQFTPTHGDDVRILLGNGFADALGDFNGTTFKFNDVVRHYSGVDYWEISSLKTVALADNTSANVFAVTALASENMIIDYSVLRNGKKETGAIHITQDGTNVSLAQTRSYLGEVGISFQGSISVGIFSLNYTSDSQGVGGSLKFSLKRWSDIPGGPGGPPSYASSGGGAGTGAAGAAKEIQFNAGGGVFGSDSRFLIDASKGALIYNGMEFEVLSSGFILLDNQAIPQTIFTMDQTLYQFAVVEYSIRRGVNAQVGRLLITNNGSTVSITDDNTFTSSPGIVFSAILSGGFVQVQYTSTNTATTGTFKCTKRKWA